MRPKQEWDRVFIQTMLAGCMYLDVAHLTEMFDEMAHIHPKLRQSENGMYNNWEEFDSIFWDAVHYRPWVYEELNNYVERLVQRQVEKPLLWETLTRYASRLLCRGNRHARKISPVSQIAPLSEWIELLSLSLVSRTVSQSERSELLKLSRFVNK